MNLLFLALEPPSPPHDGGRIRTKRLLMQASERHRVTLVTFVDAARERLEPFRALCAQVVAVDRPHPSAGHRRPPGTLLDRVRHIPSRQPIGLRECCSEEMAAILRRLVAVQHFDVAHVDHVYLAQYLPDLATVPIVLHHHNVEAVVQRRGMWIRPDVYRPLWWLAWLEQRRWSHFELGATRRCAASIAVSEHDAAHFRRGAPRVPVFVVPNGVDTAYFRPPDLIGSECGATLLFTGKMSYAANADAVQWFCAAVLPSIRQHRPDARLLVVGRDPAPAVRALASLPGVTVTGEVPDVRPYFSAAAAYVVPLRAGGGTRLKIPEAMAMGLPVVSTALGCEGLDVQPGEDILVADDAAGFAAHVVRLLDDADLRTSLGAAARRSAEARFDWSAGVSGQEAAYHAAVRGTEQSG